MFCGMKKNTKKNIIISKYQKVQNLAFGRKINQVGLEAKNEPKKERIKKKQLSIGIKA